MYYNHIYIYYRWIINKLLALDIPFGNMSNSPSSPIFPARNSIAMDFPAMFEDTGRAPLLNQPTNRLTIPDATWSIWVWLVDVTNQLFLTCRGPTLFFQNRIYPNY